MKLDELAKILRHTYLWSVDDPGDARDRKAALAVAKAVLKEAWERVDVVSGNKLGTNEISKMLAELGGK